MECCCLINVNIYNCDVCEETFSEKENKHLKSHDHRQSFLRQFQSNKAKLITSFDYNLFSSRRRCTSYGTYSIHNCDEVDVIKFFESIKDIVAKLVVYESKNHASFKSCFLRMRLNVAFRSERNIDKECGCQTYDEIDGRYAAQLINFPTHFTEVSVNNFDEWFANESEQIKSMITVHETRSNGMSWKQNKINDVELTMRFRK